MRPLILLFCFAAFGQEPKAPRSFDVRREPVTGLEFVRLPRGIFLMGSPPDETERGEDERQHRVTLTQGFWMGRTEVTRAQWERVMGAGEQHPEKPNPFRNGGPNLPVVAVSYRDVQAYLRRLEGLAPGSRFRLPTEAEWEYACRAGTTTRFHTGPILKETQANFDARSPYAGEAPGGALEHPTPVGSYPPNPWGLFDFHGNVWEWTSDWYGPYSEGENLDPHGPARGTVKVIRGGSWAFHAGSARSACRYHHDPKDWGYSLGFRLVWEPKQPKRLKKPHPHGL